MIVFVHMLDRVISVSRSTKDHRAVLNLVLSSLVSRSKKEVRMGDQTIHSTRV